MKINKLSLVVALALGGLMTCTTSLLRADDSAPATPTPGANAPAAPKNKGGKGGGGPLMEVLQKLNLSDEQKQKVAPILKAQQEQMKALRQDENLSREEKMAKFKSITEGTKEKLKEVLTPEQYTQFIEATKNVRPGGPGGPGGHRPEGAPGAPATPKAPTAPAADGGDK